MASEEPKSDIVDLLYDDELDEERREALRDEVESSEEARRELAGYNEVLGAVRQADLQEEPSESVHASIMEAARKHAAESASREAQVTRRAPTQTRDERGLWSKLNSSGVGQLVLAASVVLVAGFLFVQLGAEKDAPQTKFHAAEEAVHSEVKFGAPQPKEIAQNKAPQEEAEESAKGQPEAEPDDAPSQDERYGALARGEADKDAEQPEEAKAKPKASKKSALGEIAKLDEPRPAETRTRKRRKSAPRVARKSRSRKKSANNEDALDLWEGNDSRTEKSSRKEDEIALNLDSKREAAEEPSRDQRAERDESGISDVADLGSLADDNLEQESSKPTSSGRSNSGPAKASAPSQRADSDQPTQESVSAMESRYRSGNYAGVVTQADRYLSRSSGDKPDEARVLELKARALARQGHTTKADQAYAELQKKYPAYKSSQVERERKELADQKQKRRRQRAAEQEKQLDREVYEADEAADQAAPSSIDAY